MADNLDPYAVLGLPRNASYNVIKETYRKKARELHADLNPENTSRMADLNVAYDKLGRGKEEVRKRYDAEHNPSTVGVRRETGFTMDELIKSGDIEKLFFTFGTTSRRAENKFKITEDDLALLYALREAHKANNSGEWSVARKDDDPRGWIPDTIWKVRRDEGGRVSVFGVIKQYRMPSFKDRNIELKKKG